MRLDLVQNITPVGQVVKHFSGSFHVGEVIFPF
jgi:hypothetical protein